MRILLLYDSSFRHTSELARVIAAELGDEFSIQVLPIADANGIDLQQTDLLLIGGPLQHRTVSRVMRGWLEQLPYGALDGMPTALFDTRYSPAYGTIDPYAHALACAVRARGATLLMSPMSFLAQGREGPLAPGELGRAAGWVEEIVARATELVRLAQFQSEEGKVI